MYVSSCSLFHYKATISVDEKKKNRMLTNVPPIRENAVFSFWRTDDHKTTARRVWHDVNKRNGSKQGGTVAEAREAASWLKSLCSEVSRAKVRRSEPLRNTIDPRQMEVSIFWQLSKPFDLSSLKNRAIVAAPRPRISSSFISSAWYTNWQWRTDGRPFEFNPLATVGAYRRLEILRLWYWQRL